MNFLLPSFLIQVCQVLTTLGKLYDDTITYLYDIIVKHFTERCHVSLTWVKESLVCSA